MKVFQAKAEISSGVEEKGGFTPAPRRSAWLARSFESHVKFSKLIL